jgi:hypothetical protein
VERPDDRVLQAPLRTDLPHLVQSFTGNDREHPLLRLARQDLERLEVGLSERHGAQEQHRAHAGAGGRLAHGARDPGAAEVLQPLE